LLGGIKRDSKITFNTVAFLDDDAEKGNKNMKEANIQRLGRFGSLLMTFGVTDSS